MFNYELSRMFTMLNFIMGSSAARDKVKQRPVCWVPGVLLITSALLIQQHFTMFAPSKIRWSSYLLFNTQTILINNYWIMMTKTHQLMEKVWLITFLLLILHGYYIFEFVFCSCVYLCNNLRQSVNPAFKNYLNF